MISIIHPSRQRPYKSADTVTRWIDRIGLPESDYELIVSLDVDDPLLNQYTINNASIKHRIFAGENNSAVQAINRAAEVAHGDIFIVISEDEDCPNNWGQLILNAVIDRRDFVLKTYDNVQNWMVTMPILDRHYYERFGYIYHPDYRHMFADTHFTHVAHCLKRIIWRNDIVFPHNHPFKRSQKDEVNHRADSTWNDGKASYMRHLRRKFDLSVDIMDILPEGEDHYKWLKHNRV